jgi:hypothetical protein
MNDYLPEMSSLTKEKPDDRYVCAVGVHFQTEADPAEALVPRKSVISGAETLAMPDTAAEGGGTVEDHDTDTRPESSICF